MTSIIAEAIERSRTVVLVLFLILISGVYSYISMPKEAQPDIPIPIINVIMTYQGISPEDAERLLIRPIEKELRSIEGVKEMTAEAVEGSAIVTLEFEAGFNSEKAMDDVREKVDLGRAELPEEADEPIVKEVNFSLFPVLVVTLSGDLPERTLISMARDLKDRIEGISEVLEVDIAGELEDVAEILINPAKLEVYGVLLEDLVSTVSRNNKVVAAGTLDSGRGRISVKLPGLIESVEDITQMPIKVFEDQVVRIEDVAIVRRAFKDPLGYARSFGMPALALEIKKRSGENIIDTVKEVRAVVEEEREKWPETVSVGFAQDESERIKDMLTDLQNNVISAVFLVVVIILGSLGWRSGLLVGIAIPGSFLSGLLILNALGLTINTVVLFSLIMSVGMLVDGAIVVVELADRKMNEGLSKKEAYRLASQRMAMPIISSTLTTLSAFMPLLFWPGIVGEFMKFLPITLIATLSASLAMALFFVPSLGGIFGKSGGANPKVLKALAASEGGNLEELPGFTGWYVSRLKYLLVSPWRMIGVIGWVVAMLVLVYANYFLWGKGREYFPNVEPERASLLVRMRGNLSIDEMDILLKQVEERIFKMPEMKSFYARSGVQLQGEDYGEDVHGVIQMEFIDWRKRRKADEILFEIREKLEDIDGIIVEQRVDKAGPPRGKPINIQLSSRFPDLLDPAVQEIRKLMESVEGLRDIEDTRPVPGVEWELQVDRSEASKYGADITSAGNVVQFVTDGLKLGEYRPDDTEDEVEIRMRFLPDYRNLSQIEKLRVSTARGLVPLGNFVERKAVPRVAKIRRSDQRRVHNIRAEVEEGYLVNDQINLLAELINDKVSLNSKIDIAFKGEDEDQREAEGFLKKAFLVALFIMAIILVTQFNSFYHAFLVLTAVIFSTIGVFLGLLITDQPFGIVMNGIGVIALAGIVVNNNIVLIDTFAHLKRGGMQTLEAILRTGAQRLRPVLLTTITTILGLMPMVLTMNIDFIERDVSIGAPSTQWWVQLSTSIVFGLCFSTLLTLVLTPVLLVAGDYIFKKIR